MATVRPVTILIGILTVWPLFYFVLFIGFMLYSFSTINAGSAKPPSFDLFRYIFPLHLLTMLLMFALTAVYIVHAFRTDRIAEDRRVLWIVVLFLGNMIERKRANAFHRRNALPVSKQRHGRNDPSLGRPFGRPAGVPVVVN